MFIVMELGLGVSLWDLTDLANSQQKKKKKGWGGEHRKREGKSRTETKPCPGKVHTQRGQNRSAG